MKFLTYALLFFSFLSIHAEEQEDPLKQVEWVIGNWSDQSENSVISFKGMKILNDRYIFVEFTVNKKDEPPFEGRQLLGWDPIKKIIRSWIFDSDGGFGEGFWRKNENKWFVNVHFTLSDGRKASATNIYTMQNDGTIQFNAVERDVDGKVLPNIGPFIIKRNEKNE